MPAFSPLPLGRRIPDCLHAVSVSLPTMRDMIGYEEKDPAVVQHIASGYPRFVLHPCLRQLTDHLAHLHGLAGRALWLTASARSAAGLAAHLTVVPAGRGAQILLLADHGLHGVTHPENPDLAGEAKTLLQHTGMFLSSREAEDALVRLGVLPAAATEPLFAGDAIVEIKRVLHQALPATSAADLFPACSGMNAIYAAFRAVSELQAARVAPSGSSWDGSTAIPSPFSNVSRPMRRGIMFTCPTSPTSPRLNGSLQKKAARSPESSPRPRPTP